MADPRIVVAGAGGFIGGHLVAGLRAAGRQVRAVDIKPLDQWYQTFDDVENVVADLKLREECRRVCAGAGEVYQLAADMGGMGFIEHHKALCMLSVLTNTHMLMAAVDAGVSRFFYSSSACVYAADKQVSADVTPLKESDAYPAMAEDGYGWEKLFSERMCRHFREDFGLPTRVARYHNVYGPHGTWEGGREKAPAAICRKVIHARHRKEPAIEIWGDGQQTRSFMYIDDCVEGIYRLMRSGHARPLNLGTDELVSVDELAKIVIGISGKELTVAHDRTKPQGVRGRNSDNTLLRKVLQWEPTTSLRKGLVPTYRWIASQVSQEKSRRPDFTGAAAAVG
jgi:nucleoside-diphosphate-sugar epimerase